MTSFRPVLAPLLAFAAACGVALAGCAPAPIGRTLTVKAANTELVADGRSATTLTAELVPPMENTVVTFSTDLGLLTQTVVAFENGRATVTYVPPTEEAVGNSERFELAVDAAVVLEEGTTELRAKATLVLVPPTEGVPPRIVLASEEPRVPADGATPIGVHLVGRRMNPGDVVTITTSVDVGLPQTVTLDDALAADLELAPRTEPLDVVITASAAGVPDESITVGFKSDDAPLYNLTGTWAQISYGVVRIEGVGISPSPQVVSAPTIQKVTIEQTDTEIVAHYETCQVKMPIVCIKLGLGDPEPSTTTPSPGFAAAFPITRTPVPVRGREYGSLFQPTDETLSEVLVVGAEMDDPNGPLPDNEDATNLVDADGDGADGLTITNSVLGEESHIVVRMRTSKLVGVIESDDVIDDSAPGSLEGTSETSVLNEGLFAGLFSPTITGLPGIWKMVRVDGETGGPNIENNDGQPGITCADVKQYLADPSDVLAAPPGDSCAE
jgi:hypothetical protein